MTIKMPTIKSLEDMTIEELKSEQVNCEIHLYWLEVNGYDDYYSQKEWKTYRDIYNAINKELQKRGR